MRGSDPKEMGIPALPSRFTPRTSSEPKSNRDLSTVDSETPFLRPLESNTSNRQEFDLAEVRRTGGFRPVLVTFKGLFMHFKLMT